MTHAQAAVDRDDRTRDVGGRVGAQPRHRRRDLVGRGVAAQRDLPQGLLAVPCDVTDAAAVDAAFGKVEAEHGPVQVLVSNAGITDDGLLMRMSEESFTRVVDANLTAAYRVAKRASRGMLKARAGRMIFVSSVVGLAGSAGQVN